MTRRIILIVATVVVAIATQARAEERENWFVVEIMGSPVGFASEVEEEISGGWTLRSYMDLSMARMGTPLKMFMLVEEVCDTGDNFRSARMEMDASITGMTASAELDGEVLAYRFETGGSVNESNIPWPEDAVSQRRANALLEEWLRGSERELRLKTFRVDEGRFIELRVVRKEATTEVVHGREQRVITTDEFDGDSDTPIATTSYDENLSPFRTVMRLMGLEIVVRRVSEEEMAAIEVEPNFDIIRESMIPCSGYPDPPSRVHDVTIRLNLQRIPSDGLCGPNQKVVATDSAAGTMDVVVSRDVIGPDCEPQPDREAATSPSRFIQSDAPDIVAVADSIRAAVASDDWATARAVSRWVGHHITRKDFTQGFASALEVFETRAGDCTEHSMLLVAVLRAAGITARPAVGLAYNQGQFIGHMWAEVWLDDGVGWRTLDALDPEMTPIRIRVSASDGEVDQRALMQAYAVVGNMTAEVIDYTLVE